MSQKLSATNFLKLVADKRVDEAYTRYVAPNFIHHNAWFKGDRQSLKDAMELANAQNPDKVIDIKKVIEEGDSVMTFSHVRQRPDDLGGSVVHIFRFENGLIAELWDLGAPISKDSPNENGPF